MNKTTQDSGRGQGTPLSISVIVPVCNSAQALDQSLRRLAMSDISPLECIVVDDHSTDNSAEVAGLHGATVLSTEKRSGPSVARNLGAQAARGDIVLFIDADVCVHSNTLSRVMRNFEEDPALDAVIGSYDTMPAAKDFVSQYKNLMHCFMHQTGSREASTFWSGCGAIRRDVFLAHGGFDACYDHPAVEDIELGYRLRHSGQRLRLDCLVRVQHLKQWTFWNLLRTDILDRGIPWTELILRDRFMPNDLNLKFTQRIVVALVFLLFSLAAGGLLLHSGLFLTPLVAIVFLLLGRYWVESVVGTELNSIKLMLATASASFAWLMWWQGTTKLALLVLLSYLLLFLRQRYATGSTRKQRITGIAYGLYLLFALASMLSFLPGGLLVLSFYLLLLVVILLDTRFYVFIARKLGKLSALAAIPFHILYHFYSGLSFAGGVMLYGWKLATAPKE